MIDTLPIPNPFGAPVYYRETVTSTMDEARLFKDEASGTVIVAGEQREGRGRSGRPWKMNCGESLSFTVILHYGTIAAIPPCLTLRAGLAVSAAVEHFAAIGQSPGDSPLAGRVKVKWPNDVMLLDTEGQGRKAAGILAEAEGGTVYLGIGVNVAQRDFPPELVGKACSIAQALSELTAQEGALPECSDGDDAAERCFAQAAEKRFALLELILSRLHEEMEAAGDVAAESRHSAWRERLEDRLYLKGQRVYFVPGLPEECSRGPTASRPPPVGGILQGIGEGGEILITADSGEILSFITGELKVY